MTLYPKPGRARRRSPARWTGGLWLAPLLLALAAGCTTQTTVIGSVGDGKDLVTASDETDTAKRARLRMELASGYFGRGQMTTALDQVKLALQADPDRPLFDAALDLGYSDASSLSRQMVRVFGLRPGVARSVLGWEPLLDRWLALEANEPRLRPAWADSLDTPDDQRPPVRLARPDLAADRPAERGSVWTTDVRPRRAER